MRKLKLYIETSAWNFLHAEDSPEKMEMTLAFFAQIEKGVYEPFISETVFAEIRRASKLIAQQLEAAIDRYDPVIIDVTDEMSRLAQAYLERRIIPFSKVEDALHVAAASVEGLDAVITWNFKHLANLRKAELFHSVNLEMGYYKKVEIITPMEVMSYD
jgi:predicted nucleic acid-binding protein